MTRSELIRSKVGILLKRFAPPRAIAKSAEAQEAEIGILIKIINSAGPETDFEGWWEKVEFELVGSMKTRAWPTAREMQSAISAISKRNGAWDKPIAKRDFALDDQAINARRIQTSQPVGEHYLWGRSAVEMIRRGLITEDELEPYRESVRAQEFANHLVGKDEAHRRMRERAERHRDAITAAEQRQKEEETAA